jgi:acyl-CoA thioesterase-1
VRLLAGALCLFVAATLVTVWLSNANGAGEQRCDRFARTASARAERDTGAGRRVVVIGDSYSVGLGLEQPDASWPSRLPGRVHVAGFSGSGFSLRASGCGTVSFADRAAAAVVGADLVVVEGGLNDFDRTDAEIREGFRALVRAVEDVPLLVVGPPPAPSRAAEVPRVDALLAALAASHDAAYLSMADADLPYLDDGLHLTADGHVEFGDLVAAWVAGRG